VIPSGGAATARRDKVAALVERIPELDNQKHSSRLPAPEFDRVEGGVVASGPRSGWRTPRTCSDSGRQSEKKGGGPAGFPLSQFTLSLHHDLAATADTIAPSTRITASAMPAPAASRFRTGFCLPGSKARRPQVARLQRVSVPLKKEAACRKVTSELYFLCSE
jgi:hypothetical protein